MIKKIKQINRRVSVDVSLRYWEGDDCVELYRPDWSATFTLSFPEISKILDISLEILRDECKENR